LTANCRTARFRSSFPRDPDDTAARHGFDQVDFVFEPASLISIRWTACAPSCGRDFGGHRGSVANVTLDACADATDELHLSAGPRCAAARGILRSVVRGFPLPNRTTMRKRGPFIS
jgi:hypothetical protein